MVLTNPTAAILAIASLAAITIVYFIIIFYVFRRRESRDIYQLGFVTIPTWYVYWGVNEWYLYLTVLYMGGVTTVFPVKEIYYAGAWSLSVLCLMIPFIAWSWYHWRGFEVDEPGPVLMLRTLLMLASGGALGWIAQDRIAGYFSVWAAPILQPFNDMMWQFWGLMMIWMIPLWIITAYAVYFWKPERKAEALPGPKPWKSNDESI